MRPSPFETLQKILRLEREQGYANRAVVGGLSAYAQAWQKQATAAARRAEQRGQIAEISRQLQTYDSADVANREACIRDVLRILHRSPRAEQSAPAGGQAPAAKRAPRTRAQARKAQASPTTTDVPPLNVRSLQRKPAANATDAILSWQALQAPVTEIKGIGHKLAKTLAEKSIRSIHDLLFELRPRRYEDYRQLRPLNAIVTEQAVTVIGTVRQTWHEIGRNQRRDFCLILEDTSGSLRVKFFGQHFLERSIEPGMRLSLSGTVRFYRDQLQMANPEWQLLEEGSLHVGQIVPIYPQVEGWPQKTLRRTMQGALKEWAARVPEALTLDIRERCELPDLDWALRHIHFPESDAHQQLAEARLSFDALLSWQLTLLARRREWHAQTGPQLNVVEKEAEALPRQLFDFALTAAQERAYREIRGDLMDDRPMIRLLQGDVGSGKTAVAALAMFLTQQSGAQAALMAPTGILAEQHHRNLSEISQRLPDPPQIALLTAALSAPERREVLQGLAAGEIDLVVGTHALIQAEVVFANLALVITDEEQRFGLGQRKDLRGKGEHPHLLVMSATLMPRTLAVTLAPDMDVSTLDELPHGRRDTHTRLYSPRQRAEAYRLLSLELDRGGQAFVVNPMVEPGTGGSLDVRSRYEWLQRNFPDKRVALLHGQMGTMEKEAAMQAMAAGETNVLATTSIAEVGIDIPRASVMLIEGANRFGLAQLHQLRGRVGRSGQASYCLLIAENEDEMHNQRLQAMLNTADGFALAQLDWQQRWQGAIHGMQDVKPLGLTHLLTSSSELLAQSQQEARRIFREDPDLTQDQHALLAEWVREIWQKPQ
ncbi:MAG: ATP-dependent DNA helicase RecG [Chloroflexi bacterium]|nr:ATP-dependent DNA helicase RecG [Chloroflexota bacterium]